MICGFTLTLELSTKLFILHNRVCVAVGLKYLYWYYSVDLLYFSSYCVIGYYEPIWLFCGAVACKYLHVFIQLKCKV